MTSWFAEAVAEPAPRTRARGRTAKPKRRSRAEAARRGAKRRMHARPDRVDRRQRCPARRHRLRQRGGAPAEPELDRAAQQRTKLHAENAALQSQLSSASPRPDPVDRAKQLGLVDADPATIDYINWAATGPATSRQTAGSACCWRLPRRFAIDARPRGVAPGRQRPRSRRRAEPAPRGVDDRRGPRDDLRPDGRAARDRPADDDRLRRSAPDDATPRGRPAAPQLGVNSNDLYPQLQDKTKPLPLRRALGRSGQGAAAEGKGLAGPRLLPGGAARVSAVERRLRRPRLRGARQHRHRPASSSEYDKYLAGKAGQSRSS